MKYDYIFVGAGPANLVAVNVLLQRGVTNLVVLEAGAALDSRGCPGVRRKLCTNCFGNLCHVEGGEGGCSAQFGNKLCYFPASMGVCEYFDPQTLDASLYYLDTMLMPQFNSGFSLSDTAHSFRGVFKKFYTADILLRKEFIQLLQKLLRRPRLADVIRVNTSVVEIRRLSTGGFLLVLQTGAVLKTENVVLGCGRASHAFLKGVFSNLGIEWEASKPDIGFRLEVPTAALTSDFTYQMDPKYKIRHSDRGTARTFCACHGGVVVPVKFGDSFYADGAFGNTFTDSSNIAFMARTRQPLSVYELERWCRAVNKSATGKLLLGEVPLVVDDMGQLVSKIIALVPWWPTDDHRTIISQLLIFCLGARLNLFARERLSTSIKVYGPSIDLYWPKPKLTRGLETSLRGVFVLGDVTGVSRGFVQAMVSGGAWALNHLGKLDQPNAPYTTRKESTAWSVLE